MCSGAQSLLIEIESDRDKLIGQLLLISVSIHRLVEVQDPYYLKINSMFQ